jgi:hypothetical protein
VQVQPGRFVRVEEMSPEQPAEESDSDSPPDEPQSDMPGAPVEADSPAADADAEVLESGVEANHAGQDPTEAIVPEVRGGTRLSHQTIAPEIHGENPLGIAP